jgi:L-alanine-DL-glutamate epimerase-like enolase superfamily enzyme
VKGTEIRSVSTVQVAMQPNVLWVQVETADGALGLGETFFGADAVAAYVHETAAPYLLGKDALDITAHWRALYRLWSRKGVGAEARGASAVDIALWDLFGQVTRLPLYQLLGGKVRESIRVYNTCAGPAYQGTRLRPGDSLFGVAQPGAPDEDLWAFLNAPEELAESLLAEGISTMKIWPFDATLAFDGGQLAGREVVASGIAILERIRRGMGDRMEVALEMRSRWLLPAAKRIVAAVEPYDPLWIEDPIRNDNLEALAELARATRIPIAAGENLGSRFRHRELVASHAVGIVLSDATWCGGVTEARRVAELAALYALPFGLHDCSGPVNLAVGVHVSMSVENAFMQEIVRAYYRGWYQEVVDGLPPLRDGLIAPHSGPGHGICLVPGLLDRPGTLVRRSIAA